MELLAFLVAVLAIAATAGVAWLYFGQHTKIELTGSGSPSAHSTLPPKPAAD
jgi:hypothetical protein